MTLVQSVGVIIGANVGTTVTAQIVAFNVTAAALPLITVGFCMIFIGKNSRARHYGDMLMGLGLIFYGMSAMGDAMSPLRTHEGFIELMRSMERPIFGMFVGALFTALVQSSSATGEIESISAVIGRELVHLGEIFKREDLTASDTTGTMLEKHYEATREIARAGLRAIVDKDERAAQEVVSRREALWQLGRELFERQAARLAQDDPQRLLKHRVQVDLLDKMRRIYGVAERMAISVLPRGVLAGELAA
jgi:Na+/phosphate symporter